MRALRRGEVILNFRNATSKVTHIAPKPRTLCGKILAWERAQNLSNSSPVVAQCERLLFFNHSFLVAASPA